MHQRICLVVFLVLFGTASSYAAQKQVDPDRSSLTIHVGKSGWLPGSGHEHVAMAPIAEGSIDDGRPSRISLRVEAARLQVTPEEHQAEVQQSMLSRDHFHLRADPTGRR